MRHYVSHMGWQNYKGLMRMKRNSCYIFGGKKLVGSVKNKRTHIHL